MKNEEEIKYAIKFASNEVGKKIKELQSSVDNKNFRDAAILAGRIVAICCDISTAINILNN